MKYLIFFLIIAFTCSCSRSYKNIEPPHIYQGRIINSLCGNITVQFMDGTPLGQIGWVNTSDSTTLNNVFRVANPCNWGGVDGNINIRFSIVPQSVQNCATCLAWAPTPDTAYSIRVLH